ncbi:VOC family protein [Segnochrobactraceae bacterium EtOH-i3]
MSIRRLKTVYHVAGDMDAGRRFYEEGLGLVPRFADGTRWVQYDAGGTAFALASQDEAPTAEAEGAVAVFEVDDLDATRARLEAAGIPIVSERDMGSHGRVVTLRDPAGTYVQLFAKAAG